MGAIIAPVLMPVTIMKLGRLPDLVHPTSSPAPKAPLLPPPEMVRARAGPLISDGSALAAAIIWARRWSRSWTVKLAALSPQKADLAIPWHGGVGTNDSGTGLRSSSRTALPAQADSIPAIIK